MGQFVVFVEQVAQTRIHAPAGEEIPARREIEQYVAGQVGAKMAPG